MNKNELTPEDLNYLENSALGERTILNMKRQNDNNIKNNNTSSIKNINQSNKSNKSIKYEYDKNNILNIDSLRMTLENKIKNNRRVRRNSTYPYKKNVLLPSRSFGQVNQKETNKNFENSKKTCGKSTSNGVIKEKIKNEKFIRESEEKKLRKLKNFLIQSRNYFC